MTNSRQEFVLSALLFFIPHFSHTVLPATRVWMGCTCDVVGGSVSLHPDDPCSPSGATSRDSGIRTEAANSAVAGVYGCLCNALRPHRLRSVSSRSSGYRLANVLILSSSRYRFMAAWWAHSASYASGSIGGIVICIVTYRRRRKKLPIERYTGHTQRSLF